MLWERRPRRDQPGDAKGTANKRGEGAAPTGIPEQSRENYRFQSRRGLVGFDSYERTEHGTPQGGVVSPLLANISLNGVEALGQCVRYADDMVYIIRKGEDVERLKANIDGFLAIRGLNVKASKTQQVNMKDGFDFLGLNFFLKPNGVSASKPKKDWLVKTKKKIRDLMKLSALPKDKLRQKIFRILDAKHRFYRYSDLRKVAGEWWKLSQYLYSKLRIELLLNKFTLNFNKL